MKVAFLDSVHPILQEVLEANGFQCDNHTQTPVSHIPEIIAGYDGLVIRSRLPVNAALLSRAKKLQFIARSGAGLENIDVPWCKARNITLLNAPEANRDAVGEHAIGMLLALLNKMTTADREVRNGIWNRENNRGDELGGKTIALIGYGNNGRAFARKLSGFNVKTLAYDKYRKNYSDAYAQEANMATLFKEADVLSFHIPQTEETVGLFNDAFLARFKKPIYVINAARGKIVSTGSLVKGLGAGRVLGACLDVLEYEKSSFENLTLQNMPADLKKLLQHNRVLFTPHVAGWTYASYYKLSRILADKIIAKFG